jgi:hypothetical protein
LNIGLLEAVQVGGLGEPLDQAPALFHNASGYRAAAPPNRFKGICPP